MRFSCIFTRRKFPPKVNNWKLDGNSFVSFVSNININLAITFRGSYSVAFAVQKTADLCQVAIPLHRVIKHRRFHQKCIITLEHSFDTIFIRWYKHRRRFRVHEPPHFLVNLNFWVLRTSKKTKVMNKHPQNGNKLFAFIESLKLIVIPNVSY